MRENSRLPAGLLLIFILLAGFFGYQQLFSTFASYDDEGYVMASLLSFSEGHALYDQTYTQYGPAFFQIQWLINDVLELEVSHDVTRFKTLFGWLLISLLSAATIWKMTGNGWFGAGAFGVVFVHLDRLCLEPGHPQEMCGICLIGIIAIATCCGMTNSNDRNSKGSVGFAIIGGLIATALLTKINIGLILGFPVAIAMLLCCKKSAGTAVLLTLAVFMSFGLIATIARQSGLDQAAIALPTVIAFGLAAALLAGYRSDRPQNVTRNQLLAAVSGFLAVSLSVVTIAITHRTSVAGLFEGIVLQHFSFGSFFYSPAPLSPLAMIGACAGLGLAIFARRGSKGAITAARFALVLLLFASLSEGFIESLKAPQVGFEDRGLAGMLVSLATGLCWVILFPVRRERTGNGASEFGRYVLCFTALFHSAIAYPTPGTQMAVGSFLLLLVATIGLFDLTQERLTLNVATPRGYRANYGAFVLCLIVMSTMIIRDVDYGMKRSKMTSLDLPGTYRLRLPEQQVEIVRSIVDKLNKDSDTFIFAENTRNSYYLWTEKKPPTAINATAWPFMLKSEQQKRIIASLEKYDRVLVVRDRVDWPLPEGAPLSIWIDSNFSFESSTGPFEFWTRKLKPGNLSGFVSSLGERGSRRVNHKASKTRREPCPPKGASPWADENGSELVN